MTSFASNSKSELRQRIRAALEKISPVVRAVESISTLTKPIPERNLPSR